MLYHGRLCGVFAIHSKTLHASCFLQVALKAFEILSPIYTYVFLLIRSVVAPPTMVWFSMTLMAATKLPFACRYVCSVTAHALHIGTCKPSYTTSLSPFCLICQSGLYHVLGSTRLALKQAQD